MVSVLMPPSLSQLTAVLFVLMSAMVAGTSVLDQFPWLWDVC